jgi:autophagy-related protein 5
MQPDDYASFIKVNNRLLNTPTPLKNVPIRLYIPSSPHDTNDTTPGSFKVVQTLVPPRLPNSESAFASAALLLLEFLLRGCSRWLT